MTWLRLKGIKIVRANGRVYAYHRMTGKRLKAAPTYVAGHWVGTPALIAEVAALDKAPPQFRLGSVAALMASYKKSDAFTELAERTREDYAAVIMWMRNRSGNESPKGLTPVRAREIRDVAVKSRGWRFGKYVIQVMRVVWQHGCDYGLASENPWRAVSLPKRPRDLPNDANRPWTPQEVNTVLPLASIGLRRAYGLALLGFRPSEIPAMLWPKPEAKGVANVSRKTRFDALQNIPPALAWVFDGERPAVTIATNKSGKPFPSENALYKASGEFLRDLAKAKKVAKGLTMKGLNHTLGAALAEQGVDPRTAKDAMQKKSLATALHHSRRADTRRNASAALDRFDEWLKEPGPVQKQDGISESLENSQDEPGKTEQSGTEKS
ncbi:MAG: hypothetical protein KJZ75_17530 [Hyphomonadaceae bacterium]|nr:hypothetical protein [Hyphomonadaceae bacterium]